MAASLGWLARRLRTLPARDALLLGLLLLHVLANVQTPLVYFWKEPVFSLEDGFARPFLCKLGGPVEYASLFLSQFHAWQWAGALIIVAQTGVLVVLTYVYLKAVAGGGRMPADMRFLRSLPAVVYAMLASQYDQDLGFILVVLTALAGAAVYGWTARRAVVSRLALLVVLFALVTYLAGAGVFLLAGMILLLDLAGRRFAPAVVTILLSGLVVVASAAGVGGILPLDVSWHAAETRSVRALEIALCSVLVLSAAWAVFRAKALLVLGALRRKIGLVMPIQSSKSGEPRRKSASQPRANPLAGPLLWLAGTTLLVAAGQVAVLVSIDRPRRREVGIYYYAHHRMWEDVLVAMRELPPQEDGYLFNIIRNFALQQSGRLLDEMFTYRQNCLDVVPKDMDNDFPPYLQTLSEQNLQLGLINDAEHVASEAVAMLHHRPSAMRQLARIQLAKGRIDAARVVLNHLSYDIVHGGWARQRLRRLDEDPALSADAEIQELRSRMIRRDDAPDVYVLLSDATVLYREELAMENLLKQGKPNRVAFDLLMARCLLARRT
ncbi:MAG: DUF6057 family protein [Phycisphaerae bacterium]